MKHDQAPRFVRALRAFAIGFISTALVACGGGGGAGSQGGDATGTTGSSSAADMQVTTSAPTVGSSGQSTATITAIVKDAGSRALPKQPVTFAITDPDATGSFLTSVGTTTGDNGTVTATLNITGKSNRTIVVAATTGTLTRSVNVAVVGTSLTLSGPTSIVTGGTADFTASLKDSSQTPIAGTTVTITAGTGFTASTATVSTDSSGQAKFKVTANQAGSSKLSVAALNSAAAVDLAASGSNLVFQAPTAAEEVVVSTVKTINVLYQPSTGSAAGQTIQFNATRGTLSAPSAVTDGSGVASVTITSSDAGQSTITATAPDMTSNDLSFEFVSKTPNAISVQASPSSVGANLSGSTANSAQLVARVRDAAGNPVKGVRVDFAQVVDPSGGSISPGFATTDSSGVATASFIAGPNPTGPNAVQLKATVFGTGIASTTTLTVAQLQMFVEIGTGNELETPDNTKFRQPFTALVTDSNGAPVANAVITASVTPIQFYKGVWTKGQASWVQSRTATCANEDADSDSVLDAGEDLNGNGKLDPGNPQTVTITSTGGVTDSSGFANLAVTYPRNYADWVQVRLRVTITSQGTQGFAESVFDLPALANDINNLAVSPPGAISPFGAAAGCDNTN